MKRLILILSLLAAPAFAVQPDEILDDPVLEERARELSKGLRCLVCRNESIDESNATLARDLRLLVRERLVAGDSNEQAMDYIVERYGEFVLLRPTMGGQNLILWLAPPVLLIMGLGLVALFLRNRATSTAPQVKGLDEAEQARLKDLLDD